MKKIIICAMALLTAVAFSACTKDGVYKPSKKICRVYESYKYKSEYYSDGYWQTSYEEEQSKSLSELWHWDGNKLSSIDYYDDGSKEYTVNFTYDGNKLTRIDQYDANAYLSFIYKSGNLSKMEMYRGGSLGMSATVSHSGGKITQIDWVDYDKSKSKYKDDMMFVAMRILTPGVDHERMTALAAQKSKDIDSWTTRYTWKGGNIIEMEYSEGSEREMLSLTYDSKNNPFKGMLLNMASDETCDWGSKNNVTREQWTSDDGDIDVQDYTYNYEGNWPNMKIYSYNYSGNDYRYSSTRTYYYEYE